MSVSKTTFPQKVGLVLFGAILGLLLLESGLRLGGAFLSYRQQRSFPRPPSGENGRVLLCLGESTTAGGEGSYPHRLEKVLEQHLGDNRISVVNRGVAGTTSYEILLSLEEYLDEYQPELVVVMMGVNDKTSTKAWSAGRLPAVARFFRNLRVYKLAGLLRERIDHYLTDLWLGRLGDGSEDGPRLKADPAGREFETGNIFPVNPRTASDYLALGRWYFDKDRFDEAGWMFRVSAEIDPLLAEAWEALGRYHQELEEWEEAEECFERAFSIDRSRAEDRIRRGNLYLARNEPDEAEKLFRQAVRADGDNPRAYLEWGMLCLGQGRFERAERLFRRALSLSPDDPVVYSSLGILHRKWGRHQAAAEYYRRARELSPTGYHNFLSLIQTYWEAGELERAQELRASEAEMLEEAIRFDPGDLQHYRSLANIYRSSGEDRKAQEVAERAGEFYRSALELNPEAWWLRAELARHYRGVDNPASAKKAYREALSRNPEVWWLYLELAELYRGEDREEEVEDIYREALRKAPGENWVIYDHWADYWSGRGEYGRAGEIYRKAMLLFPDNPRVYTAAALMYQTAGDGEKAREYFRKSDEVNTRFTGPATPINYRKLRDKVRRRGIQLVCVQYPMLSVEPLREIFPDREGIIFVDNEKIFREAVAREGYWEYFIDSFAGYFGHCTNKGNQLLAENVAATLLREYFDD